MEADQWWLGAVDLTADGKQLLAQQRWEALASRDELRRSIKAGRTLAGFEERLEERQVKRTFDWHHDEGPGHTGAECVGVP